MFGGLKNLASLASLMSQAGDIQGKMAAAKERIEKGYEIKKIVSELDFINIMT